MDRDTYDAWDIDTTYNTCIDCCKHVIDCDCANADNVCPWCGFEYDDVFVPHVTADSCPGPFAVLANEARLRSITIATR